MLPVLPAYAGMIPVDLVQGLVELCAPRVCGDDPECPRYCSSGFDVLPAYAGMILHQRHPRDRVVCAPRVCGDDPPGVSNGELLQVCSPRMRG